MTSPVRNPLQQTDGATGGPGSPGMDDLDWGEPVMNVSVAPDTPLPFAPDASPKARALPDPVPGAAAPPAEALPAIEWTPTPVSVEATPKAPRAAGPANAPGHPSLNYVAHRIRERYFRARFPEIEPPSPSSPDPSPIIKSARLYFEDGDVARATELLQQCAEMLPGEERLLLAKLEIHFLSRESAPFNSAAKLFEQRFPASTKLDKIRRLAERLEAETRAAAGEGGPGERYGAWPEVANWIEAPWDLTSEVLAVELRSRLLATPVSADPVGAP